MASRAVLSLILAVALSACALPSSRGASFAPEHRSLFDPSWTWLDEGRSVVSFARWRGTPVVVTPFFTTCTLRCPMTLLVLRKVDQAYRAAGVRAEFVLITIDPHTDSPERLARFKASRSLPKEWHLLAGDDHETLQAARLLGVHAARDIGHIDHNVRIVVFDAEGKPSRSVDGWTFDPASLVISKQQNSALNAERSGTAHDPSASPRQ